ncbi:hypothetical protein EHO60_07765 [Leptospira fletcheri]|uniref:Uncharacterized protein n=1 Tax=Leptospira fletcheri TaxID=2484981 RepID=A0A4R9GHD4_9LEPT|nr:hypothetical protein [Leptospira fletcheri]TGK12154.1 hypothetical protein EHO60_07765 [Leptospira fletcheri]
MRPKLPPFSYSDRRLLPFFGWILVLATIFICGVFLFRFLPSDLMRVQANFAAKEGCSCLFVVRAEETYCKDYAKVFYSPDIWKADSESLTVGFVSMTGKFEAKAKLVSRENGCRLTSNVKD